MEEDLSGEGTLLTIKKNDVLVFLVYTYCPFSVPASRPEGKPSEQSRKDETQIIRTALYLTKSLKMCCNRAQWSSHVHINANPPQIIISQPWTSALHRLKSQRVFHPEVKSGMRRCTEIKMVLRNICFQSVWWAETLDPKQQHPHEIHQTSQAIACLT